MSLAINNQIPIVCIIGQSVYQRVLESARAWYSVNDVIVVTIENEGQEPLGALQQRKIDLANEILVLNVGGHIDRSGREQIRYAQRQGKPIRFYEQDYAHQLRAHTLSRPATTSTIKSYVDQENSFVDLANAFQVDAGALLLYGPDPARPATTLIASHVWPGIEYVPEVWYAETASNTVFSPVTADNQMLKTIGQLIRWSITNSGPVAERILSALQRMGSVSTQEELSHVISCRRESVTAAMRELKNAGLVEKIDNRIQLTHRGVQSALHLFDLERIEEFSASDDEVDETAIDPRAGTAAVWRYN